MPWRLHATVYGSARRRKDKTLEDPESGANAPAGGASGFEGGQSALPSGFPPEKPGSPSARQLDGQQDPSKKPRRRRKRRRGRKVFAKDAVRQTAQIGVPAQAAAAVDLPARLAPPTPPRPGPDAPPRRQSDAYAALDLGTNNCRLLVAVPGRPGQFRVVDAFSRIVRLGEGLSANGKLGELAMDRAIEALKICADKLNSRPMRRTRLIATEACRSAGNGEEFIARVLSETGLDLEIVNRETEARLAVSGCGPLVERGTEGVVLFDIGGGSSEIALIDVSAHRSPRLASHIVAWTSLKVGVVSLAERYGGRDVGPDVFEAMTAEVVGMLADFTGRNGLDHLAGRDGFHLLGTSGTVTTLAGVHLGLPRYDRRQVDGLWMTSGEVDGMISKFTGWSFEERVANPCIGADRADLVLAGCAILEAIRRTWPAGRLRVADRGLREGILTELMARDGVWRRTETRR